MSKFALLQKLPERMEVEERGVGLLAQVKEVAESQQEIPSSSGTTSEGSTIRNPPINVLVGYQLCNLDLKNQIPKFQSSELPVQHKILGQFSS